MEQLEENAKVGLDKSKYIKLYDDIKCADVQICKASLYQIAVSVACLFDISNIDNSIYGKELKRLLSDLDTNTKKLVDLFDSNIETDYSNDTFNRGYLCSPRKDSDEKFDPIYHLYNGEMYTTLGSASLYVLVKVLRLFLDKLTFRIFGPRTTKDDDGNIVERIWNSDKATYGPRGKERSTLAFVEFANKLLTIFSYYDKLSSSLDEIKNGDKTAMEIARNSIPREPKKSYSEKKDFKEKRLKNDNKNVKLDVIKDKKPKEVKPVKIPIAPTENPWKMKTDFDKANQEIKNCEKPENEAANDAEKGNDEVKVKQQSRRIITSRGDEADYVDNKKIQFIKVYLKKENITLRGYMDNDGYIVVDPFYNKQFYEKSKYNKNTRKQY
jgi:hypothetical protein